MLNITPVQSPQSQAGNLLDAIHKSPAVYLPRRVVSVEWLGEFLSRARRKGFAITETEGEDLVALDQFLRTCELPIPAGNNPE